MYNTFHLLEDVKKFSVLNLVYVSVRALNTGNSQYFMSFITESLSKIILLLIYIVYFLLFVYLNCLQLQVNFKVKILQNTVYFITKYSVDFLKYFNGLLFFFLCWLPVVHHLSVCKLFYSGSWPSPEPLGQFTQGLTQSILGRRGLSKLK